MIDIAVTVNTTYHTDTLEAALSEGGNAGLNAVCDFILERTRAGSPVATGAARASWYKVTPDYDGYALALSDALGLRPTAQPTAPVPLGGPDQAIVSHSLAHPLRLELGTARMPPRPHFIPAVEAARAVFPELMAQEIRKRLEG